MKKVQEQRLLEIPTGETEKTKKVVDWLKKARSGLEVIAHGKKGVYDNDIDNLTRVYKKK